MSAYVGRAVYIIQHAGCSVSDACTTQGRALHLLLLTPSWGPPPAPTMLRAKPRRPLACVQRHPFLFTLMTLTAAAELGLTAFLLSAGTEYSIWSSPAYHSLYVRPEKSPTIALISAARLVLMCFEAAWTVLFSTAYLFWLAHGGTRLLAGVASSVLWLLLTAVLWVCMCCAILQLC